MWTLRKTTSEAKYFLPCNKNTVIGRKDVDIILTGDTSVSRKHSVISIQHDASNLKYPDRIPTVTVTDTSKFGTFILRPDNEKSKINSKTAVRSGDIIQFGAQASLFEIRYEPLVVVVSIPDNDALKVKLQETVLHLGGHLVNNWHNTVTHLVTEKIKLSVKMAQALVSCCHIVTPEYLFRLEEELGKCSENALEPEKFMPDVGEPNLRREFCNFNVNKKRKSVFENKSFIFMCKKQLKRLGPSISGGNGGTRIWSNDIFSHLKKKETVFVDFSSNNKESVVTDSQYQNITDALTNQKRRFIQEHEIGLAILYCDASVYCNPAFDMDSQIALSQSYDIRANTEVKDAATLEILDAQVSDVKMEQTSGHDAPDQCNLDKHISTATADPKPSDHCMKDWEAPATINDSCLDDDSLWSQNYEPMLKNGGAQHEAVCSSMNPDETTPQNVSSKSTHPEGYQTVVDAAPSIKLEDNSNFTPFGPPAAKKFKKQMDLNLDKQIPEFGKNHNFVHDLPTNVAVIGIEPLIADKRKNIDCSSFTNLKTKNFKLFRKVWPTYMGVSQHMSSSTPSHVPHIIGSSDLYVNVDETDRANVIGKFLHQPSADSGLFT